MHSVVSPRCSCRCGWKRSWEERACVHACLCTRPSFTGRGENHRRIDHRASSRQTTIASTRGGGAHTYLLIPLSLLHGRKRRHTQTASLANPHAWYNGLQCKNTHLPTDILHTSSPHLNIEVLLLNPFGSDFKRIQVLVERNEGFQGSAGVDGCGSDHSRQNLHVHDGTVKERTKKRHLDAQGQKKVKTLQHMSWHET